MRKEAVFTVKIETELRDAFMAEAQATHRPASQIVRELMRDFVERQREAREHDAWFRAEVEEAMREADDPNAKRILHEVVEEEWCKWRAALAKRLDAEGA
jgi:hypothetical protein